MVVKKLPNDGFTLVEIIIVIAIIANSLPHAYPQALNDLVGPNSNPPYKDTLLASMDRKDRSEWLYH